MKSKIIEVNLENGMPTVDTAIKRLKSALTTYKGMGYKAVIVIHGYGSTGVGGSIKTAVHRCLREPVMVGIVRNFISGENWVSRKKEALGVCKDLQSYEARISNNLGITIVFLR